MTEQDAILLERSDFRKDYPNSFSTRDFVLEYHSDKLWRLQFSTGWLDDFLVEGTLKDCFKFIATHYRKIASEWKALL